MPRRRASSSSDRQDDGDSSDDESDDDESDDDESDDESDRHRRAPPARQPKKKRDRGEGRGASNDDGAGVYVLRNVESGVCYVGKSDNVARSIEAHHRGYHGRTATLRREATLRTRGSVADLESWERNEVLARMYRDGMDSVRGWRYTRQGPLTEYERRAVKADIVEKYDLCRRCGRDSHFANRCFASSAARWCAGLPL